MAEFNIKKANAKAIKDGKATAMKRAAEYMVFTNENGITPYQARRQNNANSALGFLLLAVICVVVLSGNEILKYFNISLTSIYSTVTPTFTDLPGVPVDPTAVNTATQTVEPTLTAVSTDANPTQVGTFDAGPYTPIPFGGYYNPVQSPQMTWPAFDPAVGLTNSPQTITIACYDKSNYSFEFPGFWSSLYILTSGAPSGITIQTPPSTGGRVNLNCMGRTQLYEIYVFVR